MAVAMAAEGGGQKTASALSNPWLHLIFCIVCMATIANLQYAWPLFRGPIANSFSWNAPAVEISFTIFLVVQTWLVPLEGVLIDNFLLVDRGHFREAEMRELLDRPDQMQSRLTQTLTPWLTLIADYVAQSVVSGGSAVDRILVVVQAGLVMAALVAHKTKRPARLVYGKDDDMVATGKRHPFQNRYRVGFTGPLADDVVPEAVSADRELVTRKEKSLE